MQRARIGPPCARRCARTTDRRGAVRSDPRRLAIGRWLVAGEAWEGIGAPGDDPAVPVARGVPLAIEHDPIGAAASSVP